MADASNKIKEFLEKMKHSPEYFYCPSIHSHIKKSECEYRRKHYRKENDSWSPEFYGCKICTHWEQFQKGILEVDKKQNDNVMSLPFKPPPTAPYGFKRVDDTYIVDESEWTIINLIKKLREKNGLNSCQIAKELTDMGFTNRVGNPMNAQTVRAIYLRIPTLLKYLKYYKS